jgi:hypothetical protein
MHVRIKIGTVSRQRAVSRILLGVVVVRSRWTLALSGGTAAVHARVIIFFRVVFHVGWAAGLWAEGLTSVEVGGLLLLM